MDTKSIIQLISLIILLILSAFFSSAETSLTTVSVHKLKSLADIGSKRAIHVLRVSKNSGKLLSTILIGNNIVNLSASAIATTLSTDLFGSKYVGVATGILTFLVLIFGEITPKTIATSNPLKLSMFFSYPIGILMVILTPVIWLLNIISNLIFKLLRINPDANANTMTEGELLTIVHASHKDGVIESEERKMISNVVDFGDALSKEIMIPRADVTYADVNCSYEELFDILKREQYSRIPIFEDSKDNVIGILHLKDLFFYTQANGCNNVIIRDILRKPLYVFEYQRTSQIFAEMKTSSISVAIVLNEYGIAVGLITMEDLIEEIVGEIRDEYDEDESDLIIEVTENVYDVDASIKLSDLNDALGTNIESDDYDSIGGFMIELLDRLPQENDTAKDGNLSFLVTKVSKNRVERITVTITPTELS